MAGVLLDNYTALSFLLASQGQVCVIYNTPFFTWINKTGKVEQSILRLKEKSLLTLRSKL